MPTNDNERMARFAQAYADFAAADSDMAALFGLFLAGAWEQYERAGLPCGNTDGGLVRWLTEVSGLTPCAPTLPPQHLH